MTLSIRPLADRRDRTRFVRLPWELHGANPHFVPTLELAVRQLLDRRRNPFWKRAEGQEWLAWRGARIVGRIGACRDEALFAATDGLGAVGFFDCENDPDAAAALFEAARAWLAARGCARARAPLNYTIHDTAGLLVECFDEPPTIDTTWNPPYYEGFFEAAGFVGVQDLLANGGLLSGAPPRARRFADRLRGRGFVVRPLDLRRFREEAERVHAVYNRAWADNWGHVPIPFDEFYFKAKDLRGILDPALVRIAEYEGEPVGLAIGLPDVNPGVRAGRGRLLPLGWFHLLRAARRSDRARMVLLGVAPGFRQRGLEAFLLSECFEAIGSRYRWGEASWVLAENAAMLQGLRVYGLETYRRWRIYESA